MRRSEPGSPRGARRLLVDSLQLLGLSALVFAQPLLDLLGRQPEFFVVRGSHGGEVAIFLGLLLLALPTPLLALRGLAEAAGERWGDRTQAALIGGLVGVLALQAARGLDTWAWLLAGLAALSVALVYRRYRTVRLYASFIAPAVILVPLLFLAPADTRRALAAPSPDVELGTVESTTPVVVVVFDELTLPALLDEHGGIDGERFPSFARLAAEATWFPNAFAVADTTKMAIPAMLTGRLPEPGQLPFLADHPVNLFTLLGGSYQIFAEESLARLCPPELNRAAGDRAPLGRRLQSLVSDAAVVWLHLTLPTHRAEALPRIDIGWGGFVEADDGSPPRKRRQTPSPGPGTEGDVHQAATAGLVGRHQRLPVLPQLVGPEAQRLYFFHVLLPHTPWEYLPEGQRYFLAHDSLPPRGGTWPEAEEVAVQGFGRYLLQLLYTDRWLGELLEALRHQEIWESALVIVTADHGAAFVPGEEHRFYSPGNAAEVASVPLFVKRPGQRRGEVVEGPVSTLDLLPTVLEVLGVPAPPALDGRSLLAPAALERSLPFVLQDGERISLPPDLPDRARKASERFRRWVSPGVDGPLRSGPRSEVVGLRAAELGVAGPSRARVFLDRSLPGAEGDRLPLLVSGLFQRADVPPEAVVAVATGGVVQATSSLIPISGDRFRFAALLPESALAHGATRELYLLTPEGSGLKAERLHEERAVAGALEQGPDGEVTAVVMGDARYELGDELTGFFHSVTVEQEALRAVGWAVDPVAVAPAEQVAFFLGERFLGAEVPSVRDAAVARALGEPRYTDSVVDARFPAADAEALGRHGLRAFALARRGTATELGVAVPFIELVRWGEGEGLRAPNGKVTPVVPGGLEAHLDEAVDQEGQVLVNGWAGDLQSPAAGVFLAAFSEGRFLVELPVMEERFDVSRVLEVPELSHSGFLIPVPTDALPDLLAGKIRVFVVSRGRPVAVELPLARFLAARAPQSAPAPQRRRG